MKPRKSLLLNKVERLTLHVATEIAVLNEVPVTGIAIFPNEIQIAKEIIQHQEYGSVFKTSQTLVIHIGDGFYVKAHLIGLQETQNLEQQHWAVQRVELWEYDQKLLDTRESLILGTDHVYDEYISIRMFKKH